MNGPVLLVEQLGEATSLVTLNRPNRRNALSIELMEALCSALSALAIQSERRVVILQGAGAAFCSGMDLREAAELGVAERTAPWIARTLETLATSPLVTIAAVHGAAYAGGGGLMACCDFIVAAEDTKIGFPEVRRGLLSALITPVLRSRLRDGDLRELLLLGDPIDARRAMQMGLVGRVVPMERLLDEAKVIAATVLLGGPETVRRTKRMLRESGSPDISRHLARALELHQQGRRSDEAREGLDAFLEHRAPRWCDVPSPSGRGLG